MLGVLLDTLISTLPMLWNYGDNIIKKNIIKTWQTNRKTKKLRARGENEQGFNIICFVIIFSLINFWPL
jgi:hypothetical protein